MHFSEDKIRELIITHYNIVGDVAQLPGELDYNFRIDSVDGQKYIFKVANVKEIHDNLVLQHAVINHLQQQKFGLTVSKIVKSNTNEEIQILKDEQGKPRFARLLTWVDGRVFAKVNPHSNILLQRLGEMCGKLCASMQGFDHPAAHRFMKWDPSQAGWTKEHLSKFTGEKKEILDYFYSLFESIVLPALPYLRMSVNYNDANDYNVLVSDEVNDPDVPGVIDFGDVVFTHTINELAIAIAYAAMNKPNPLEAACCIVKGFNETFTLDEKEISVLYTLVSTRLLISVVCSELNRNDEPENAYLQISDAPAWDLLKKWKAISPAFAHYSFRNACEREPHPQYKSFIEWAGKNTSKISMPCIHGVTWLDLNVGSTDLGTMNDIVNNDKLDKRIAALVSDSGGTAFGRYDESRAIYITPSFEIPTNDGRTWRTIHIGLDFFCNVNSEVKAVADGIVHSFADNNISRDYGPTIILEHHPYPDLTYYTLYGHLSRESLKELTVGKEFKSGEVIGRVGDKSENGGWTPHLHFQVMLDLLGRSGEFPGVCTPEDAATWKSICPDPWLFITGKKSPPIKSFSNDEIVSFRKQHIGKNLSISYKNPIKMVRGAGQFLIDNFGKRYLDTVNNVAHVGHEHPRVVEAGQRQMAVLNTNTRYLHDNLVKFTEELLTTLPPQLNVVFMVNSGSEANELAMRIAKTYTNQKDMIVSQVGYHGNTSACIDISSYKFDRKGGKGKPEHIHVVPIPDTYRGIYQAEDAQAGYKYATHVRHYVDQIISENRKPAAFIFESIISCGGQVELPEEFLQEAYRYVREAGGVCIADEVQTGCGRVGSHFWAFQQHHVVPDIVTIGKPIGNGHPLGVVVTTQELADAFKNGMEYFNTFGGNPVSCAIGLEVLRVIADEQLQGNAMNTGNYLKNELKNMMNHFEIIGDVRGAGLFLGFELVKSRVTKTPATEQAGYLANRMRDKGILMSTDGPYDNVLKIKPPMVFAKNDADFLLENVAKVLKEDSMQI